MQISHVIRAEEHLSNTPRQIFISRGLGLTPPEFAHLPFVAEPGSKNKLSKRKLDKYLKHAGLRQAERARPRHRRRDRPRDLGRHLQSGHRRLLRTGRASEPEALVNYLLLLGWSLDDKTEFFTRENG